MSEEEDKSIEKIEEWLRRTSSLISEKVYGQVSEEVSEEEYKEELLKQISKELYKDEWFIEKAILSYKNQQEKTYTFYKDNSKEKILQKYNWCQRPCDTNMSLCRFVINGEVEGYMSESLVSHFDYIEQIDLNEFIHHFVKPLIKENIELKKDKKALVDNYNIVIGSFISKDKIRNLKEKISDRIHLVTEDSPMYEKISEFKDEGAYNILEELLKE